MPAQKIAVKSEEAVPVQKPTVNKASPTPAVHRSGPGANLSRADSVTHSLPSCRRRMALTIAMAALRTRF